MSGTTLTPGLYQKNSLDVYAKFRQSKAVYTITRDLGDHPNTIAWQLAGQLNWEENQPNENSDQGGSYLEILDNKGKTLTRLYTRVNDDGAISIHANNTIIDSQPASLLFLIIKRTQPLAIAADSSGITFQYAHYAAVKTPLFDSEANWRSPSLLRLYFWSSGAVYDRVIDIQAMRFQATLTPTIPTAPTLSTNHMTSTLRAFHALGNSEIMVSENDSPYVAYKDPMNMGKQNRPAGYWKFKIKAAAGRKESPVTESPPYLVDIDPNSSIHIYPNPAYNTLQIQHPPVWDQSFIEIFSTDGKRIGVWWPVTGSTTTSVNIHFLQTGSYLLRFTDSQSSLNSRFIKQ